MAYVCERPETIRGVCSIDEALLQSHDVLTAPVPALVMRGTKDGLVHYTMVRNTVDALPAYNGLLHEPPIVTFEAAPKLPGQVTQATWWGTKGVPVAFITVGGGSHLYPQPSVESSYDSTRGMWAFFSQFVTTSQVMPKILQWESSPAPSRPSAC